MNRTFLVTTNVPDDLDPELVAQQIADILIPELDDPYLTCRPWSTHDSAPHPTTFPPSFPPL